MPPRPWGTPFVVKVNVKQENRMSFSLPWAAGKSLEDRASDGDPPSGDKRIDSIQKLSVSPKSHPPLWWMIRQGKKIYAFAYRYSCWSASSSSFFFLPSSLLPQSSCRYPSSSSPASSSPFSSPALTSPRRVWIREIRLWAREVFIYQVLEIFTGEYSVCFSFLFLFSSSCFQSAAQRRVQAQNSQPHNLLISSFNECAIIRLWSDTGKRSSIIK